MGRASAGTRGYSTGCVGVISAVAVTAAAASFVVGVLDECSGVAASKAAKPCGYERSVVAAVTAAKSDQTAAVLPTG